MRIYTKILILISVFSVNISYGQKDFYKLYDLAIKVTENSFPKSEIEFLALSEKYNKEPYVQYIKICFYLNADKSETALKIIEESLELKKQETLYWYLKSFTYLTLNKTKEAKIYIDNLEKNTPVYWYLNFYYSLMMDDLKETKLNLINTLAVSFKTGFTDQYIVPDCFFHIGTLDLINGDTENSIENITEALRRSKPNNKAAFYVGRSRAYFAFKDTLKAMDDLLSAFYSDPDTITLGFIYALKGNKEKVDEIVLRLVNQKGLNTTYKGQCKMYSIACYYAILNQKEKALEYLEKSLQLGYDKFNWIQVDFDMKNIKNLPGFTSLIQKYQINNQK